MSPEDVKEDLIHSMQKYVEVDEPEPDAVPVVGLEDLPPPVIGQDDPKEDTSIDRMTEEEPVAGIGKPYPRPSLRMRVRARADLSNRLEAGREAVAVARECTWPFAP